MSRWGAWPDQIEVPDWTEGPGGYSVDGGDESTDSEGGVQVDEDTVYKCGSTRLPVVPATREQRPVIKHEGDRGWKHPGGVRKPSSVLGVLWRTNFPGCEEGYEKEAAKVLEAECRRLLQNLRHESRPQAIRYYYATHGIKKHNKECCGKYLKKEKYMKEHHNKMEMPELYDLYGMAHTTSYTKAKAFSESDLDDPKNFTNISSHHKLMKYRDVGKAWKCEDFNPSQEPLDQELVMISSGGRPHGSIAIADGIIRSPLTLPEIKAHE
ncbi:hypothetical protein ZWY2020_028500 [Hordeum vulgare]|nr:hypothetical protein ZWY2020_028500 [Hordeum vulgare]